VFAANSLTTNTILKGEKMKRFLCFPASFFIFFIVMAPFLPAQNSGRGADVVTEEHLYLFYAFNNPCETCHDDEEFYAEFGRQIQDIPNKPIVITQSFNVFQESPRAYFEVFCEVFEIDWKKLPMPILVIGDGYLAGDEAIKAGARDLYLRQRHTAKKVQVEREDSSLEKEAAAAPPKDFPATGVDNSILVVLVTSACENCEKAKALLGKLPDRITLADGSSSPLDIYYFNVAEDEGLLAALHFSGAYKVPESRQIVPTVFYTGGYLAGYEEIAVGLDKVLSSGAAKGFVYPGSTNAAAPELAWRELPAIFLAGLLGGVNPCSVSMLLLLLSLLAAKSGRILPLGLTYVGSKMIAYLALGFGLFSLGQSLNQELLVSVSGIIRMVVIILSLLLCALNLADFVNARRENYGAIKVQLPAALRRFNHRLINKVTATDPRFLILGIFFLGLAVSAGEFLCTGQIYLATILYLLRTDTGGHSVALLSLLCYTLAAALPPAIIVVFCYKGKQAFALSEFARQRMPLIKLANAALFALFAVLALLFF
jgi:cytochrome c biogenesis protein CcdA